MQLIWVGIMSYCYQQRAPPPALFQAPQCCDPNGPAFHPGELGRVLLFRRTFNQRRRSDERVSLPLKQEYNY